ncbi:MAG: DNA-processing protein DprA [bacterium]|nr:DNA-processing protein DprA [bacterium]
MAFDFKVSSDTQVALLLCGKLGRADREITPLTLGQYNVLALALHTLGKRPGDLLEANNPNDGLIAEVCAMPNENRRVKAATPEQICSLLRRGVSLATALDKWASYGVRVISRADGNYPARLRTHLGGRAPVLLYYIGNETLLAGGGMAFVGSRDITTEASDALRHVVRDCVELDMPVVSGGARGADQTAMQTALASGGKVIGVLPCDLLKATLDPLTRDALANGSVLLLSAFDPEVRPFSYGQVAMDRNKYIYAMADAAFVAQSGVGSKSGTWSGADEELKNKNANPLFVYYGTSPSAGCVDLAKRGAIVWDMGKTIPENFAAKKNIAEEEYICDDLFALSAASSVAESEVLAKKVVEEKSDPPLLPYDAFLAQVRESLKQTQKESDVKKKLAASLDLVPAQVKHWLERAIEEGWLAQKESVIKNRKAVVLVAIEE